LVAAFNGLLPPRFGIDDADKAHGLDGLAIDRLCPSWFSNDLRQAHPVIGTAGLMVLFVVGRGRHTMALGGSG
jgi:hypothetical protein